MARPGWLIFLAPQLRSDGKSLAFILNTSKTLGFFFMLNSNKIRTKITENYKGIDYQGFRFFEDFGFRLHFRLMKYMTSLWPMWLMEPWIWVSKVENRNPCPKALKIDQQIKHAYNISKICRRISILPEVMGDKVGPEIKHFWSGSQKMYFWIACYPETSEWKTAQDF